MNTMTPTQRTFTDVETGYKTRLYTSNDASKWHLIYEGQHEAIADGCEVNGYYLLVHRSAEIRLNTKRVIFVGAGQFYNYKEGEHATHRKFTGFSKFTKL